MGFFPGLSTTSALDTSTTNSNSSFDAIKVKLAPKNVQLLADRCAHGGKSMRSYHGPLDILENQSEFDSCGIQWNEMFELGMNNDGQSNVVTRDAIELKIRKM